MQLSRQALIDAVRRAGLSVLIDGKERELPDPIVLDRDEPLLANLGITRGSLTDAMGGGP